MFLYDDAHLPWKAILVDIYINISASGVGSHWRNRAVNPVVSAPTEEKSHAAGRSSCQSTSLNISQNTKTSITSKTQRQKHKTSTNTQTQTHNQIQDKRTHSNITKHREVEVGTQTNANNNKIQEVHHTGQTMILQHTSSSHSRLRISGYPQKSLRLWFGKPQEVKTQLHLFSYLQW